MLGTTRPTRVRWGLLCVAQSRYAYARMGDCGLLAAQRASVWERVRTDFVPILGRRVAFIATGGAPTPPVVAAWVERVWQGKHLVNSYGATEVSASGMCALSGKNPHAGPDCCGSCAASQCGGITADGAPMKKESWQLPIEIKLLDHPDSGFRTTDSA